MGGVGGADNGRINEGSSTAGGVGETGGESGDDEGESEAFEGVHGGEG